MFQLKNVFTVVKEHLKKRKLLSAFLLFFVASVLLNILFPLPVQKENSKVVLAKDGTLLTAFLTVDDKWRLPVHLDEISPQLIEAIIQKEDKWFYWHPGVNPVSLVKAFFTNLISGEIVSGASTITMQTARMLEPARRTYLNKFLEMLRAVQLEVFFSKDEILEMYLSMLPYGGNIEGVKSASYIYFNRPPAKLSLSQSILLAVIPNDPNRLRIDRSIEKTIEARNKWLEKFKVAGVFTKHELNDAANEPISPARYQMPLIAPHFCYFVNKKYSRTELRTTLDLKTQKIAEQLLLNYVNRVKIKGVSNGAVFVIDNKTASVAAYCGSSDFYDATASGQVNGVNAVRSPGSTLKPALYAFAFDIGMLTPKMRLLDIPSDFGGYEPENFTPEFKGSVTAAYALLNSLNVPAVRLLNDVELKRFISLLKKSGFNEIEEQESKLGLSLILGGCGVRLEQLTNFFSSFAKEGKLYKTRFLINEPETNIRVFSASSSYMIADILSGSERPDFPKDILSATSMPRVAWKTGTSYGKRDAWAIGFTPRYTIGVWMGNFDGKGSPYLSGAEMAVPLLLDLFNSIDKEENKSWFRKPESLGERKVCAETGLLPSVFCKETTKDFYIRNVSHSKTCNLNKEIFVSDDESISYCIECLPKEGYKKKVYTVYEPELSLWYDKNNHYYEKPPTHNPLCQVRFTSGGPNIISPSENFEYLLEENSGQELMLQAASDGTVKTHFWYINEKFYKKSSPFEKIFFKPGKGKNIIACLDDKGRESTVIINVKYY